jgi:hypothetical protein
MVAMGGNGNAIVVWQQFDGASHNIWGNRYSGDSKVWSGAFLLETKNGTAEFPIVAMDGHGNAVVVWEQSLSGEIYISIWANRYSAASQNWTGAFLLETNDVASAQTPQIAMDNNGNVVVVWVEGDGTRNNVWANRYTSANQTWAGATLIEFNNAGGAFFPQVAMDRNGNAFAVWRQIDGTRSNIWNNRYSTSNQTWLGATLLEFNNTEDAYDPYVAMGGNGNTIVVWHQYDGTRYNAWANSYSAAARTWSGAFLLETTNSGNAYWPQVAMGGNDNAIAIWVSE